MTSGLRVRGATEFRGQFTPPHFFQYAVHMRRLIPLFISYSYFDPTFRYPPPPLHDRDVQYIFALRIKKTISRAYTINCSLFHKLYMRIVQNTARNTREGILSMLCLSLGESFMGADCPVNVVLLNVDAIVIRYMRPVQRDVEPSNNLMGPTKLSTAMLIYTTWSAANEPDIFNVNEWRIDHVEPLSLRVSKVSSSTLLVRRGGLRYMNSIMYRYVPGPWFPERP